MLARQLQRVLAPTYSHLICQLQESTLAEERAKEAQKAARQAEQLLNDSANRFSK